MTGPDHEDPPAPPTAGVPDLINDYRAQQNAWRQWESQLERLHDQILAAAERDAAKIVSATRADIRRRLVEARRDLLALASQVRVVTEGREDPNVRGDIAGDAHDRLLSARHDVRRLLDEARPDLEKLSEEARALHQRPQPKVSEGQTRSPAPGDQGASGVPASPGAGGRDREWLSGKTFVTIFTLAAAAMLLGLVWWPRSGPASVERGTPQAAASAPAVQSSEPSPAVDGTPRPAETAPPRFLSLIIEARREAWIQSTIDGQTDAGRLYQAGDTRRIEGARSILLRVGDAGAVAVSVNGKEAEILGQDSRIVTRRYTADDAPVPPANSDGRT